MTRIGPRLRRRLVTFGLIMVCLTGCHRFAYQELDPQLRLAAVDENKPIKTIRWSKCWGVKTNIWSPVECAGDSLPGDCKYKLSGCAHNGPGRMIVKMKWYSIPALIGTFGYAMPVEVQIYCRADCPCKKVGEGP